MKLRGDLSELLWRIYSYTLYGLSLYGLSFKQPDIIRHETADSLRGSMTLSSIHSSPIGTYTYITSYFNRLFSKE